MPAIPDIIHATELRIDLRANAISLRAPMNGGGDDQEWSSHATIDIGTSGRLLGIELHGNRHDSYLCVMDADQGTEHLTRSTGIRVSVSSEALTGRFQVVIPRRGEGYDISWPSGNQCWSRRDVLDAHGHPIQTCAVFADVNDSVQGTDRQVG